MLGSFTDADYVAAIEKAGLVGVAMEKLPRQLSSAQSMDEMTSQNSVMGYKAAIVAANAYGSFLPMMTTAAGTIRPAKVLILAPVSPACRPSAPPSVSARRHRVRRASGIQGRSRILGRQVPRPWS